jgi:hypothetical protein
VISNQLYLFNPTGADYSLTGGKSKLPSALVSLQMVVPRAMCVVFRASCLGIPSWGLRGFAQLQAEQLTPFQNFGAFAVRQGQTLQLWLWDKTLEAEFSEKHGDRTPRQVFPQSVFSAPIERGVQWFKPAHQDGLEAQLWADRFLIDSMYFESAPSSNDWAVLVAQQPDMLATGWPASLPAGSQNPGLLAANKAWAGNLLKAPLRLPRFEAAPVARAALWVGTAVLAAGTASVLTERYAHTHAIEQGVENQKKRLAELEPVQQDRDAYQSLQRWLASAQTLVSTPTKLDTLNELATLFTRQGLLVRELEVTPPTISATLVSAGGAEIRLTSVIGAIEANPLFTDARFVDVSGGNAFKFTWRLKTVAGNTSALLSVQGLRP